jgi:sodium transport system ATP-binding protein
MIEARALRKCFGSVQATHDVSFTAQDGRITGLLGPNGAGKTTTLRMLYTLLKPDAGEVMIDGVNAGTHAMVARRSLGVLPDARGLYKRLTARENIEYYAQLQGLDRRATQQRIDVLCDVLDMRDFLTRRTEGFSQGQRVKTAIARALVHNPHNVIFDEPTNGLDVLATRNLREFLKQLKNEGRCVLFSSHVMQEVAALCDHIVIIAQGRVVAQGSAEALRKQSGMDNLEDAFVKLSGCDAGGLS